jgi:hypothetical protein
VSFQSPPPQKKTAITEGKSLDVENIKKNVKAKLKEFPLDAFGSCFVRFVERCYSCAAVKGEYFIHVYFFL